MFKAILFCCIVCFSINCGYGQQSSDPPQLMELEPDTRAWFRNPDGSCVQCSIGMAGVHCNCPEATTLLWDTPYGPKERGGSWPGRVANYCNSRHIEAYNVTGNTTIDWCRWAAKTGRFGAIGAGGSHFQTLYGFVPNDPKPWRVCNNNSTHKIDEYTEDGFRRLHYASGPWVVILKRPSSENPRLVDWWTKNPNQQQPPIPYAPMMK